MHSDSILRNKRYWTGFTLIILVFSLMQVLVVEKSTRIVGVEYGLRYFLHFLVLNINYLIGLFVFRKTENWLTFIWNLMYVPANILVIIFGMIYSFHWNELIYSNFSLDLKPSLKILMSLVQNFLATPVAYFSFAILFNTFRNRM